MRPPRYILPKNLPEALRQLDDGELGKLFAATLAERKRRQRNSSEATKSSSSSGGSVSVPRGQVNAVRAALKAGVTPSRIAREFGISLAEVRKITAMG